jgi:hypothetical protein
MKSYRIAIGLVAFAGALAVAPTPAQAQAEAAALAAPIMVRAVDAMKPRAKPAGSEWLKAEVIHADSQTLIVRERENGMMIHTFTFSPNVKYKMRTIVDKGGYQYGDKIRILHQRRGTVALRISGKPSKPL